MILERIIQISKYFEYLIRARHSNGHGIHSPFVFELVSEILFDSVNYPEYDQMNRIRKKFKNMDEKLTLKGYGAGSRKFSDYNRKVSELVKIAAVKPKFQRMLYRMAKHYQPERILELGTSLGMGTLAFYYGYPSASIITVEAEPELSKFAENFFNGFGKTRIQVIQGTFEEKLPGILGGFSVPGLVFIDGDHSYEPVMRYFREIKTRMQQGIIILDDINWSRNMRKAWKAIQAESDVTIDLFYVGIVIVRRQITPGHYRVRF